MPQAKSKFIYFYEYRGDTQEFSHNSALAGDLFSTEAGAKQHAVDSIIDYVENVYGDFDPEDWMIHIGEVHSATVYKLRQEGITLASAKKLV